MSTTGPALPQQRRLRTPIPGPASRALHARKADAVPGKTYQLTGKVAKGTWEHHGTVHTFRVEDRKGGQSIPVRYEGSVPDPFREGREIVVDVRKEGATFVGQPDTLVTKCPSKFTAEPNT